MGIGGISWPQILVILVIVLLIFGTKRIRNIGSDLGGAIKEFRKGVGDGDENGDDGDGDDARKKTASSGSGKGEADERSDGSDAKREH